MQKVVPFTVQMNRSMGLVLSGDQVEHCVSNAKVLGSDPKKHTLIVVLDCPLLWMTASTK